MTTKKDYMIVYLKDMLEYLDGNGLVITDEDLLDKTLNERVDYEYIAERIAECELDDADDAHGTFILTDFDELDLIEETDYLEEDDE